MACDRGLCSSSAAPTRLYSSTNGHLVHVLTTTYAWRRVVAAHEQENFNLFARLVEHLDGSIE